MHQLIYGNQSFQTFIMVAVREVLILHVSLLICFNYPFQDRGQIVKANVALFSIFHQVLSKLLIKT